MKNRITNEELKYIIGGCEEEETGILAPAYCPQCKNPQLFRFWGDGYATCTACEAYHNEKVVLKLYDAYRNGSLTK